LLGREFVRMSAILQKLPQVDDATERAIRLVDMEDAANRPLGGYSKGMRQRIKVAAALVHDPRVLLLDEPLNGTDPVQRASLISLMRRLGDEGKSVIVSSHVLSEVERFARSVLVVVNGKLAAAGDYRTIRERMDERDHIVRIRSSDARRLASALVAEPVTRSVRVVDGRVIAETQDVRAFSLLVPELARREGITLFEVQPVDESLASVFSYLVGR
jgi:ABC-2 type transport system ATP-binding protein